MVDTTHVDLDGLGDTEFWAEYLDNGLVGTAIYYLPHLAAMPERAVAALTAIVTAPPGAVLFHCMGGRDRTGMIALLLLAAVDTVPEDVVDDYLETVRLGDLRAATSRRNNDESDLDALCRQYGTTTENAFREVVRNLDLAQVLDAGGMAPSARTALHTWRGTLVPRR